MHITTYNVALLSVSGILLMFTHWSPLELSHFVKSIGVSDLVELLESVPKKDLHKGSVTRDLESSLLTVSAHEHVYASHN